jgi:non-ribosomal peptide synthetase component E (peptide arylation enzyme)
LPIIRDVTEKNPTLKHVILVRQEGSQKYHRLEKLLEETELDGEALRQIARRKPDANQVASLVPTGGTTGLPKLAIRTHNDYICGARYKAESLERGKDDIALIFTPVGHNLGLVMVTMTLLTFGKIVLLDSTRPEDICSTIEKEKVTFLNLVPALLTRLVNFGQLKKYDITSLKKLHVGAQHSPPELIKSAYETIGVLNVISAFGMAEGPALNTRLSDARETIHNTVGKPCCTHDTYKVLDVYENDLPCNTEGEFVARGPSIFGGYFGVDNRETFTGDGFFKTGDLAVIDKDGYVKITGRIKDIIIRGGVNISAIEVEELLIQHPDVEDVAVVGIPDKELGEKVCACLQPIPGKTPDLHDIASFSERKGASSLLIPQIIEVMDTFPLTPAGKVDKKAMREEITKRMKRDK